jgi:hypothetical protein
MRPKRRACPDQGIRTAKKHEPVSLIAAAAVLCLVGAIAGSGVYSQIVADRDPATASKSITADRTDEAEVDFAPKVGEAVGVPVGASTTGVAASSRSEAFPRTFGEVESRAVPSAELAQTRSGQIETPSAKPDKRRPRRMKAAEKEARAQW